MDETTSRISLILHELEMLKGEALIVLSCTRGLWGTAADRDNRHFPYTFYGFVVEAMAKVDYLSKHWILKSTGRGQKENQTVRMVQFMRLYLGYDTEASEIAVQFFRHNLVHTSGLAEIHDKKGNSYT
jgi:hypothetical protein